MSSLLFHYFKLNAKFKIFFFSKILVSEDEVCIDMAIKYNANIVISSSGLKCLLDNHPPKYCREWIIPIVIKEFDVGKVFYYFYYFY